MANTDAWGAAGRSSFVKNLASQPAAPAAGMRLFPEPTYRFLKDLEPALRRAIPVLIIAFLAVIARRIPAHRHACHSAFAGPEHGDFRSERVVVTVTVALKRLEYARHPHARHFGETVSAYSTVICVRMRGVKLRRQSDSPSFIGIYLFNAVVIVLSLGVDKLAKSTRLIYLPHSVQIGMEA